MSEIEVSPPAAVVSSAQLKVVILVMGLILSGAVGWATWVTIQVNDTQKEVAVISSNRYTPKDRLEDMKQEAARFDAISKRVDAMYDRLGGIEGDIKELKAVILRMEQSLHRLDRKDP